MSNNKMDKWIMILLFGCALLGGRSEVAWSESVAVSSDTQLSVPKPVSVIASEEAASMTKSGDVRLVVYYDGLPARGLRVVVVNLEGVLLSRFGAQVTDADGKVLFSLPVSEQYRFRVSSSAKPEQSFEKLTQSFRAPTQVFFEAHENQAPVLEPIGSRQIKEGEVGQIPIKVSDPEGDRVVLEMGSSWPSFARLEDHGEGTGNIRLSPEFTDAGVYELTLAVREAPEKSKVLEKVDARIFENDEGSEESSILSDQQEAEVQEDQSEVTQAEVRYVLGTEETFILRVEDVNRAPEILVDIASVIEEGEVKSYPFQVTDPDNKEVECLLSYYELPRFVRVEKGEIILAPEYEDAGKYQFHIIAREDDPAGLRAEKIISFEVKNRNRPPAINRIENQLMEEGQERMILLQGLDPDNPYGEIIFEGESLPPFAKVIGNHLVLKPGFEDVGIYRISVIALKPGPQGLRSRREFQLEVEDVERPPMIKKIPDLILQEGDEKEVDIVAFDPEGKRRIFISTEPLPEFVFLKKNKLLIKPKATDAGEYRIAVIASAPHNQVLRSKSIFKVTVKKAPRFGISGRVVDSRGEPVSGVMIRTGEFISYTDDHGLFLLDGVVSGDYTIIPGKARYRFVPSERVISVAKEAVSDCDFEASLVPVLQVYEPKQDALVFGNRLDRVLGAGYGSQPSRILVNGINARMKVENQDPLSFQYSFVAERVPLEFDASHEAKVLVSAFDNQGELMETASIRVIENPLSPQRTGRQGQMRF